MTGSMNSVGLADTGQRSFDDFFVEFAREVAAMIALSTGDLSLAEDVTQEAMARAALRWSRVSLMERPDLWVLRVARRLAIDAWRKRRREAHLDPVSMPAPARDEVQRLWVLWGLEQLEPSERMLIILRHRDGLSIDEVADHLGKRPSTAAAYLKRARRHLRLLLSEGEP